ncbi:MAG: LacI family transcriptional regulator [Hyphomicrobiales bacterium]|nr:MAG: LacI family transcriptional regulator [Hyphomicrobiales bacterium]
MQGIARLAKELGISTGTVSRALNGKPDVNEATRQRVLEAARSIGYAPNQAARALAQGQTQSVGFMIDLDRDSATSSDNFFMGVFDGVQSVLTEHGLDLLLMPCPSGKDHRTYLERFATRGMFDAMILASVKRDDKRIELLQAARIPFVLLGRCATQKDYAWIDLDFETSVTTALERMIALGHRRIAVTVPKGGVNFGFIFLETYQQVLARNGIAFDPALVFPTIRTEIAGYEVMDTLLGLRDRPTAILLVYELAAIGVYRRLIDAGLEPGRDMAVVGLRDDPSIRFLEPALTCFELSLGDLGRKLGTALLAQIPRFQAQFSQGRTATLQPMALKQGPSDSFPPRH